MLLGYKFTFIIKLCAFIKHLGASIAMCCTSGHHIVAVEEDEALFIYVLKPLIHSIPSIETSSASVEDDMMEVDDDLGIVEPIQKKSRFST